MKRALTVAATALVLVVSSCGGDDAKKARASPVPSNTAEPEEAASPPSAEAQLPPAFVRCMADQGYEIESADEMHSAPMQAVQTCLPTLHGTGSQ